MQNPALPPSAPLANAFTVTGLQQGLFVPVIAKGTAAGSTIIHVQNISSAQTSVFVLYYDINGHTEPNWTQTANILAGASEMFDSAANNALPAGFDGSAVVQSAQAITAVVNRVNLGGAAPLTNDEVHTAAQARASAGSFPAFANGTANTMTVPVTFGGYRSYRTTISIQNTGPQPATYNVSLFPTGVTTPIATVPRLIAPLAASRVRLGTDLGVPADFIGTAVITGINGATLVAASETLNGQTACF